jgi:hypothetical protein
MNEHSELELDNGNAGSPEVTELDEETLAEVAGGLYETPPPDPGG